MMPRPTRAFARFQKAEIEQSIPDRFERQTVLHATRLAVKTRDHEWSYAELNASSNRIARSILSLRGDSHEPVALLSEQGATLVAAILGVLKAGKFYVPLDPKYPVNRLARMLDHSGCVLIVADEANRVRASELAGGRPVLIADRIDPDTPGEDLRLHISPDNPAYIFYTSGSTGQPKGVVDNHRNVLHNIMRYTNGFEIGVDDRLTLLQSCSFSGSVSSLFNALLNGAAVFPFDPQRESISGLAAWLREQRITMYHSVPALFRQVVSDGGQFPDIRVIRLEGDQAAPVDVDLYKNHFSDRCILSNGLGATEMGIVRRYVLDKQTEIRGGILPVGYPAEDMEVTILDDNGGQAGCNEIGEIAVKSKYLAVGYWRNEELTRSRFQPCPEKSGVRLYRTGDVGRMRSDGCLEHLGRKDFQLKVRGYKVDIGEIEAALRSFPQIREAVVTGVDDRRGQPRVAAYLVSAAQPAPTTSALRRYLEKHLPEYMIPSVFVMLDSLPLNENGKVNRKALPPPDGARPRLDSEFVAPRTSTEKMLAKSWSEVLGVEPIGVDDNFFELGGQSLDAMQIISRHRLTEQSFVSAPRIRAMAMEIDRLRQLPTAADGGFLVPVQPEGDKIPLFCAAGHDGELIGYSNLARHLSAGQPIFAFPPPQFGEYEQGFHLRGLAKRCVGAMQERQPQGPYILAGFCFGGCLVYEMAQQLEQQGHKVALLVLIECFYDGWIRNLPPRQLLAHRLRHLLRRSVYHARNFMQAGDAGGIQYLHERSRVVAKYRQESAERRAFARYVREGQSLPSNLRRTRLANWAAVNNWIPQPYSGRVLLLGSLDPRARVYPAPLMGWQGMLTGHVESFDVADNLRGLLAEPAVRLVAQQIEAAIARQP